MRFRGLSHLGVVAAAALACAGCGSSTRATSTQHAAERARVLRVPSRYPTIQRAVDAARPGDLVLIAPGTYHESVTVNDEHPRIVIRGTDRNRVILDGGTKRGNGIAVQADGVAVENLTVRRYLVNGVVWSPPSGYSGGDRYVQGWRGSYLTAYDNGLYQLYAFGAQHGGFDHTFTSGGPDSGIYVGHCKPCHALVRDNVAQDNHVGLEITNASGDVVSTSNVWRRNRVGVQINSLDKEAGAPQTGVTIAGDRVLDNDNARAPRGSNGFGAGIVIDGGRDNVIERNRVAGHVGVGIIVLDSADYGASGNRVTGNALAGNRVDLALDPGPRGSAANCFAGNAARTTVPRELQRRAPCGRSLPLAAVRVPLPVAPPQVDYRTVPAPPAQASMANASTAPARPAVGPLERVDIAAVSVPGAR